MSNLDGELPRMRVEVGISAQHPTRDFPTALPPFEW